MTPRGSRWRTVSNPSESFVRLYQEEAVEREQENVQLFEAMSCGMT